MAPCDARACVAAFEVTFVKAALTEWRAQLSQDSYKQATRKWLVRQGYSQSGGIIMSFEGKIDPCEWVTRLRMLQDTSQLADLVKRIEVENAKKAESVAQLLPRQKQERRVRRTSISLLGRMSSSSPKADIRGVGQQVSCHPGTLASPQATNNIVLARVSKRAST